VRRLAALRAAPQLTLRGSKIALRPQNLIGSGGEADVYDLGNGTAVKIFKRPDHPDYAFSPAAQTAAGDRIAVHQKKLPLLQQMQLPSRVIKPDELVIDARSGDIAGYAMRLVQGEPLIRFSDRGFRAAIETGTVVRLLCDLLRSVSALHDSGVVIGDFNDLNVIAEGEAAWLIDSDSYQFPPFVTRLYTLRFLDPLHTDGKAMAPASPHDSSSDWYAFNAMAMQLLLFVDPYGGVHRPPAGTARVPQEERPLQRMTIFHPEVRYPKHAYRLDVLPDDLLHHFERTFVRDDRRPFPSPLLESLRWTRCACGTEHARAQCPQCAHTVAPAAKPLQIVRGTITATIVPRHEIPRVEPMRRTWIAGDQLLRDGRFGPEVVGTVLERATRFWTGSRFGFGFYGAGALVVGFVFDGEARGINDTVPLPPLGGEVVDADCVFTDERCWLLTTVNAQGRLVTRYAVITRDGRVEGTGEAARVRGNAAFGRYLFVATDEGIERIDCGGARVAWPDTEPFADSSTRLIAGPAGLYAIDTSCVRLLRISAPAP